MGKDADNVLFKLRIRSGFYTQRALADASGVHPQTICYVENGKRKVRLGNAIKLATALRVPLSELEPVVSQRLPVNSWRRRETVGASS